MDIKALKKQIDGDFACIKSEAEAAAFHQKFLSKSGLITSEMKGLGAVAAEKRAELGAALNGLKRDTETALLNMQRDIKNSGINEQLAKDRLVDITIPARVGNAADTLRFGAGRGLLHPITRVTQEVVDVFASMGFIVEDGLEIVTEYENFDALNIPHTHPARDMQDTFWLENGQILKTHTSASQNKLLKKYGPEFRAIFPGRCFRNENVDATHENTFFQVEGMMVGKDISVANLIYFMKTMLTAVFNKEVQVRLRPGFFPFVEPGFELDATCMFCGGSGCSVCKHSGWIELCPCGMVHPSVLKMGGVDPDVYQGFAFGLGLTRLAMIKFGINEIRHFNSGNLEFLKNVE